MTDARKLRWWLLLIILACAGLYLIGNGRVPLWDRDEGWYAQCSKQMWETGDWVVPRFLERLRTEKPVFVYWLQLGGYALFGGPGEFAVRFYAAVAQTLVLCILGFSLFRLVGPSRAVWTTLVYGTCAMAIISAKMCLTDATLMVFLMTVQMCLLAFYLGRFSWSAVVLLFVALGFGALTKGPVVFIPPLLTLVTLGVLDWERWAPLIRPKQWRFWNAGAFGMLVILGGLVITVAVCAPWLWTLHHREPRWLPIIFKTANEHFTQSMDGHKGPFGYYLLLVWGTYFPWSLLLPTAAYVAWKQRHVPQTRFAIAAVIGPWLFFEFMKTKLPHYPLPTYPFISLLVADAIVRCSRQQYLEFFKPRFLRAVAIWAIPVGLVASAPWAAAFVPEELSLSPLPYAAMVVVSILGFACTLGTLWFFYRRQPLVACGWLGGSFVVLIATMYGWLIPQSAYLQTSSRVAEVLRRVDGLADQSAPGEVATIIYQTENEAVGFQEPTLDYYQGGTLKHIEVNRYLEDTPPEQWPRIMILTNHVWALLDEKTHMQLRELGRVRGFLYSDERRITDVIIATRAKP